MGQWVKKIATHQCDYPSSVRNEEPEIGWEWQCECGLVWSITKVVNHAVRGYLPTWKREIRP